jgi:hypothetical protein
LEDGELFFVVDSNIFPIREGIRTAIAVEDINDDGYLDMIVGNYAGGISFYKGVNPPDREADITNPVLKASPVQIFPNPVMDLLYFRCLSVSASIKSVYIYDMMGRCLLQKNMESKKEGSLDVSTFATGLYITKFVFEEDGMFIMTKFLKE